MACVHCTVQNSSHIIIIFTLVSKKRTSIGTEQVQFKTSQSELEEVEVKFAQGASLVSSGITRMSAKGSIKVSFKMYIPLLTA